MRSDKDSGLKEAVSWFRERNIKLYGINTNPMQSTWTSSPKAYGHLIIDDLCLGIPLTNNPAISERSFVNWKEVRKLLVERGILK